MKMGHCKIVAVAFIVMMQLFSLAPVMACNYCPPAIKPPPANKPPPAPVMSPPMIPVVPPPAPVMSPPMIPVVPPPAPVMSPPMTPVVPPPISPSSGTCPLDALKLGACADVLGGLVHLSLGDPSVNKCCPVLQGVLEIEAALCLCTTIKLKVLNLNIALPLALELLAICGINPPPGFTCPTL
ncbi:36.4 kDa proline-rich protein [Cryptomeria japonica]|uniref:36.4 kDa proline-rich protein n=1 Tax=Cryptomeria japonica TaxID=3369 RepID=UPI0027DA2B82|nr:36.4 kDa proline-rich protein [Cryptomeria japonica]